MAHHLTAADDRIDAQIQAHVKRTRWAKAGALDKDFRSPAHIDAACIGTPPARYLNFNAGDPFCAAATAVRHKAAQRYPQPLPIAAYRPHVACVSARADRLNLHDIHTAKA